MVDSGGRRNKSFVDGNMGVENWASEAAPCFRVQTKSQAGEWPGTGVFLGTACSRTKVLPPKPELDQLLIVLVTCVLSSNIIQNPYKTTQHDTVPSISTQHLQGGRDPEKLAPRPGSPSHVPTASGWPLATLLDTESLHTWLVCLTGWLALKLALYPSCGSIPRKAIIFPRIA